MVAIITIAVLNRTKPIEIIYPTIFADGVSGS